MNIKISNGYYISEDINIFDFQEDFNAAIRPLLMNAKGKHLGSESVYLLDSNCILSSDESKMSAIDAVAQTVEDTARFQTLSDNAVVHLFSHPTEYGTLALFYGPLYAKLAFEQLAGVSSYFYWENEPKPFNFTDEQWLERLDVWENVVNLYKPIIGQGLQMVALNPVELEPQVNYILNYFKKEHMPSIEDRTERLVSEVLGREYIDSTEYATMLDMEAFMAHTRDESRRIEIEEQISPFVNDLTYESFISSIKLR